MRRFPCIAAVICLAGCGTVPHRVRPAVHAAPSSDLVVRRRVWVGERPYRSLTIRFVGNEHATPNELAKDLVLLRGVVDDDVLTRDKLVVDAWYFDHGYVAVRTEARVEIVDDAVLVTFQVREGAPHSLRALDVYEEKEGVRVAPLGWKRPFADGAGFSRARLVEAIEAMRRTYADLGYAYVDAYPKTTIDSTRHEVSLVIAVQRGPKTTFGRFRFEGTSTVSELVVREQLLVTEGAVYHQTNLEKSKEALLATGWFSRVDVSTAKGSKPELVDVTFELDDRDKARPPLTASRGDRADAWPSR